MDLIVSLALAVKLAGFAAVLVQERNSSESGQVDAAASAAAGLRQQAAEAEAAGDAAKAEELLRAALEAAPRDVATHVALGRLLYEQGSGAEGLGLLWRATEIDGKDVAAAATLAEVLLAERDYYESQGDTNNADANLLRAKETLDRVAKEPAAGEAAFRALRVRVLMKFEEGGEEAFALALALVAEKPDDAALHALMVDAAAVGKGFDAALAWYDAQEGLEPWMKEWFAGSTYAARATWNFNHYVDDEKAVADYAVAEQRLLAAARLRPDWFEAAGERVSYYRSWAGWIRHRQERYDEAQELFLAAWGRNPRNENAITGVFYLCGRWYDLGDLERAREGYRQLTVMAPARGDFWNNYALLCRDTGQYEESWRAYRRAVEIEPDNPRTINDCALILLYHLHRDLDLAERWFVQAEDLARANLAQAENDGDDARAAEQRAILGDALVNLARLFGEQGKLLESAEHWNELRAVDPARPELPENGGR